MAAVGEIPELYWQAGGGEYSVRRPWRRRRPSRLAVLIRVLVSVAAGMLISHSLASSSALSAAWTLVGAAVVFPILSGWFLKERRRPGSPERKSFRREPSLELPEADPEAADDTPASLLIVSSDMRIRFANHTYLEATLQSAEDVVGWRLEDVMPGEGLEEQAKALLKRSYTATSCCFTTLPGRVPTELRPVSITMMRLPPPEGEDRILVVVEDLLRNLPACQLPRVEGYVC